MVVAVCATHCVCHTVCVPHNVCSAQCIPRCVCHTMCVPRYVCATQCVFHDVCAPHCVFHNVCATRCLLIVRRVGGLARRLPAGKLPACTTPELPWVWPTKHRLAATGRQGCIFFPGRKRRPMTIPAASSMQSHPFCPPRSRAIVRPAAARVREASQTFAGHDTGSLGYYGRVPRPSPRLSSLPLKHSFNV